MERSPGALGGLTFSVSRSLTVGSGVLVDMVVFLVVAGDRGRIVVTDQVPGDWLEGRGGGGFSPQLTPCGLQGAHSLHTAGRTELTSSSMDTAQPGERPQGSQSHRPRCEASRGEAHTLSRAGRQA